MSYIFARYVCVNRKGRGKRPTLGQKKKKKKGVNQGSCGRGVEENSQKNQKQCQVEFRLSWGAFVRRASSNYRKEKNSGRHRLQRRNLRWGGVYQGNFSVRRGPIRPSCRGGFQPFAHSGKRSPLGGAAWGEKRRVRGD